MSLLSWKSYQGSTIAGPVGSLDMMGYEPGFAGTTNAVADRVV